MVLARFWLLLGQELVDNFKGEKPDKGRDLLRSDMMAKRSKKSHNSQAKLHGYVVVTFADDTEQARDYESLLKANEVPVEVAEQADQMGNLEIAIMVPDEFLDEAHVIIESQDAYDDFYDLALDDEDETDFDSDIFEDDF